MSGISGMSGMSGISGMSGMSGMSYNKLQMVSNAFSLKNVTNFYITNQLEQFC